MNWIGKIILGILGGTALVLGFGWVTMSLWNWLMPGLFGLQVIDFWQALGLLVLSKILFSGFHRRGRCGYGWHRRRGYWRKRWEAKMATMSPEEKEKFLKGMDTCGWYAGNWCEPKQQTPPGSAD